MSAESPTSVAAAPAPPAPGRATVVEFPSGLAGLGQAHRFERQPLPGLAPFERLRALQEPSFDLIVVPPGSLFPDYVVALEETVASLLGIGSASDAEVLVIVTVPPPPALPSANLLGPLVLSRGSARAAQVVQVGSAYDARTPLPA